MKKKNVIMMNMIKNDNIINLADINCNVEEKKKNDNIENILNEVHD